MILHLVTDRRRLAPAADDEGAMRCLLEQARHAVAAGIDVIQLRERDLAARPLAALTMRLVSLTRRSRTRVVVNERLDVALAAGADGVHLRGDSFDAAAVRRCAPVGFLVGRSVRSVNEARAAGPVDYLVAGTVWSTPSKPASQTLLGPEGLASIVAVAAVPVLAIGGIHLGRVSELRGTGAGGVAAIGAWIGDAGPQCGAIPLLDRARAFRLAGDAANMGHQFPPE